MVLQLEEFKHENIVIALIPLPTPAIKFGLKMPFKRARFICDFDLGFHPPRVFTSITKKKPRFFANFLGESRENTTYHFLQLSSILEAPKRMNLGIRGL